MSDERSTFMEADFGSQEPWDADAFVAEYDRLAERQGKSRFDITNETRLQVLQLTYSRNENLDFNTLARQELSRVGT